MRQRKQRGLWIINSADDISDIEVARQNERFSELLPDLEKAKSTDDIKKKYQKALNESA